MTILILRRNAFGWSDPELQGRPVVAVGALCAGPADGGDMVLTPLQQFGSVLASSLERRFYRQHQSMLDASAPAGRLYYWKSHYLPGPSDVNFISEDGGERVRDVYSAATYRRLSEVKAMDDP